MFYQCRGNDIDCKFRLDVLCAFRVKILHRSHKHRLRAIRGTASFICGVCGTQHPGLSALFYFCDACDFWIHSDCASSPNAVIPHAKHKHCLILTYNLHAGSNSDDSDIDADDDSDTDSDDDLYTDSEGSKKEAYTCEICSGVIQSSGLYLCVKCRYYAHIKCVVSDPHGFKPVLMRDAKLANLLHFPLANEHSSVMRYIIENMSGSSGTTSSSNEADTRYEHHQSGENLFQTKLHQHPLIFHDHDDFDIGSLVSNACVQFISPPFYSCTQCPDFFLHSCCTNLPSKIQHTAHQTHTLFLFPKAPQSIEHAGFFCKGCKCQCNGFTYSCNTCGDFNMDVVCALMPPSITHDLHGKTHILYMSPKIHSPFLYMGNYCDYSLTGICYECSNCRNFKIHAACALLPSTVQHKYDEHPLKLTTIPEKSVITGVVHAILCEICEGDIIKRRWYYRCNQCDQSFHVNCIPSVGCHSRINFGVTVRVNCHNCPLTLIRESTVYGCRCGYCRKAFREGLVESYAFECSNCNFMIHLWCAKRCLLKT